MGIIGWIVLGFLAGVIGKALVSGDEGIGFILTTILGHRRRHRRWVRWRRRSGSATRSTSSSTSARGSRPSSGRRRSCSPGARSRPGRDPTASYDLAGSARFVVPPRDSSRGDSGHMRTRVPLTERDDLDVGPSTPPSARGRGRVPSARLAARATEPRSVTDRTTCRLVILGGDVDLGRTSAWVLEGVRSRLPAGENDGVAFGRRGGTDVAQPVGKLGPNGSETCRGRDAARETCLRLHDFGMPCRGDSANRPVTAGKAADRPLASRTSCSV